MRSEKVPSEFRACVSEDGTRVSLANQGLSSLPEWLGDLTAMTRLELSGNQLSVLPEWLGSLTTLTRLELSGNQLSMLPDSLGNLTALTMLYLDGNQLSVLPDSLGNLTALTMLYLGRNKLSVLPESISNLAHLNTLYLYGNQLTVLPESLGRLISLTTIYLGHNQLRGLPDSLGQLAALTSLDVSGNQLAELPVSLSNLTALTSLDVSGNQLRVLPDSLGNLTALTRFDAASNRLVTLPDSMGNLTALTMLYLSGNQLITLPESIGNLTDLTSLDLSSNRLSALPDSIGNLTDLTSLDLSSNRLSALPGSIGNLTDLTSLYAGSNLLAALPTALGELTALNMLYLNGNQLTSSWGFDGLPAGLAYLDLTDNRLRAVPEPASRLSELTHLYLDNNQLTELPEWIGQLRSLQELSLRRNMLSALPSSVANLKKLDSLYVSNNQLSTLPESLRALPYLRKLFLNNNGLASLPAWLGSLESLTHLYLSENHLVELPESIGELASLSHLNLANNQLEGLPDSVNKLSSLELISLTPNPLRSPLAEIAREGTSAIQSFMRQVSLDGREQWGSKLVVVGEGGTGKTSLVKKLTGLAHDPHEPTTHGIQISSISLDHPTRPGQIMALACWDFGGQDIYHATHQFFLSDRALFLLIWNARLGWEQAKLPYWLDIIKARAPMAQIILIATHSDDRPADLPLADLSRSYPQITASAEIDNVTGRGIDELRILMANASVALPLMGSRWPASWLAGAEAIRAASLQYAAPEHLRALLVKEGIIDQAHQTHLLRALHALGDILYYDEDDELADAVILHPQWVTSYISKILDSVDVAKRAGLLARRQVQLLWSDLDIGLRDRFLRLMEKFDLSYRIHDSSAACLVVERLPWEAPDYQDLWLSAAAEPGSRQISIRYRLNTIPPGVPTWVIAREHRFSTGLHWRSGAVLRYTTDPRVLALIMADRHNRTVDLIVRGPTPQMFFSILQDGFESTLRRYEGLDIQRLVPCTCGGQQPCIHLYNYEDLTRRLEVSPPRLDVECPKSLKLVNVNQLLFGLPASTGDQILARLETISETVADFKIETAWAQREFLKALRSNQAMLEAQCPSLFTITPASHKLPGLPGKKRFELRLYCEEPGFFHPLDSAPYIFEQPTGWLIKIRPYLSMLVTVLKHTVPLAKPVLGIVAADLEERVKNEIELMQAVIEQIPGVALDENSVTRLLESAPRADIELDSDYRAVYALLDTLDSSHQWAGLSRIRTPEDQVLWLCREHARTRQQNYRNAGW